MWVRVTPARCSCSQFHESPEAAAARLHGLVTGDQQGRRAQFPTTIISSCRWLQQQQQQSSSWPWRFFFLKRADGERAHVRQSGDAERRGEAEPAGDTEAARGEVLPPRLLVQREGPPPQFRGQEWEAVAVQVLLLEQQPELCDDQRVEPFREGEEAGCG